MFSQGVELSEVGVWPESIGDVVMLRFCASGAICSVSDWLSAEHNQQHVQLLVCLRLKAPCSGERPPEQLYIHSKKCRLTS